MNLVLFAHPKFLSHQSMPRFSEMVASGMRKRGHKVELWSPKARAYRLPLGKGLRKWLGYLDQYILFPLEVKSRLNKTTSNTLFVFTDQALGPWVPLVVNRPHVIHCHDFLAQRSALGEIPQNITGWSGRQYQAYIRRGYLKGKNFVSVSSKTREDLHRFFHRPPLFSKVVYNGMNQSFQIQNVEQARVLLGEKTDLALTHGYLLHVGGNDWYKNRTGVIEIYNAWRTLSSSRIPLLLIGTTPSRELLKIYEKSIFKSDIHFLSGADDKVVRLAYAGASLFLFPSIAEGFGWPIAEAMASGCIVITTNAAPMTEVAGDAAYLIPCIPNRAIEVSKWAKEAAKVVEDVLTLPAEEKDEIIKSGILNAKRFDTDLAMDQIESIYLSICEGQKVSVS